MRGGFTATPEPAWPQTRPRQGRRERQRRLKRCCRAGRGLQARCNGRRSGLRPSAARSPVVLRRRPAWRIRPQAPKVETGSDRVRMGGRASATSAAIPPRSTLASAFPSTTLALEETLVIAARLAFARCSWGAARRPPQALRGWRCDGLLGGVDLALGLESITFISCPLFLLPATPVESSGRPLPAGTALGAVKK